METVRAHPEDPNVSAEQQASNEIIKRIRKLRWIGMEEEAKSMQQAFYGIAVTEVVLRFRLKQIEANLSSYSDSVVGSFGGPFLMWR